MTTDGKAKKAAKVAAGNLAGGGPVGAPDSQREGASAMAAGLFLL